MKSESVISKFRMLVRLSPGRLRHSVATRYRAPVPLRLSIFPSIKHNTASVCLCYYVYSCVTFSSPRTTHTTDCITHNSNNYYSPQYITLRHYPVPGSRMFKVVSTASVCLCYYVYSCVTFSSPRTTHTTDCVTHNSNNYYSPQYITLRHYPVPGSRMFKVVSTASVCLCYYVYSCVTFSSPRTTHTTDCVTHNSNNYYSPQYITLRHYLVPGSRMFKVVSTASVCLCYYVYSCVTFSSPRTTHTTDCVTHNSNNYYSPQYITLRHYLVPGSRMFKVVSTASVCLCYYVYSCVTFSSPRTTHTTDCITHNSNNYYSPQYITLRHYLVPGSRMFKVVSTASVCLCYYVYSCVTFSSPRTTHTTDCVTHNSNNYYSPQYITLRHYLVPGSRMFKVVSTASVCLCYYVYSCVTFSSPRTTHTTDCVTHNSNNYYSPQYITLRHYLFLAVECSRWFRCIVYWNFH
ncbi:hypothetical protein J6590_012100 [Homalodisca vitripennis]|nr:hypothetical protein J6590_012100 [Homalodisca vitripennis]